MTGHYNKDYFEWQKELGKFEAEANFFIFEKYTNSKHNVIEFGCGGGYLLNRLPGKGKIGVEINPVARNEATINGIKTVSNVNKIPNNWADRIISINALEHVFNPLGIIRGLYRKLKIGGKIIFIVPCENNLIKYCPGDINQHLFSWSPMNIGNLFQKAGYKVKSVKLVLHKWPPFYQSIRKIVGWRLFHLISLVVGRLDKSVVQVKIVAIK